MNSEPIPIASLAPPQPDIQIRRATAADIDAIHNLISEASKVTTVLPRSRESISAHLQSFVVAEKHGPADAPPSPPEILSQPSTLDPRPSADAGAAAAPQIIGCGALGVFTQGLAEIKSLVVAPGLRGAGLGGKLVAGLVAQARTLGIQRLFALTDNVPFFEKQGFREASKATLPHKVWNECIHCPKFLNCTEDAVDLWLIPHEPPA